MNASTAEQVFDIVAKHTSVNRTDIDGSSTLKALGLDSLEAIETLFDVEEHFDINFPDRDPNLDDGSLSGLVEAVDQALTAKATAK
ncbi:MAG: phosphopantetheine-binding protein, partial [Luteimonas sp.]